MLDKRSEGKPGPKPKEICLSESERDGLEKIVRRHNNEQQKVLRARIILLADQGEDNARIGRIVGVSTNTARQWRKRWVDLQAIKREDLSVEERLEDLPRPGAPAHLTTERNEADFMQHIQRTVESDPPSPNGISSLTTSIRINLNPWYALSPMNRFWPLTWGSKAKAAFSSPWKLGPHFFPMSAIALFFTTPQSIPPG
jgi:hypothetical protein